MAEFLVPEAVCLNTVVSISVEKGLHARGIEVTTPVKGFMRPSRAHVC